MNKNSSLALGASFFIHLFIFIFVVLLDYKSSFGPAPADLIQISLSSGPAQPKLPNARILPPIRKSKAMAPQKNSEPRSEATQGGSENENENSNSEGASATEGLGAGSLFNQYLASLTSLINQSKKYPKVALLRGIEGRVLVSLLIGENGQIRDVRLQQSSGFSILDEEALRSIKALRQVPPLVGGEAELRVEVPIRFELRSK